jgi:prepilin-type N-terminal cleavage/methylation domain-containing protein
MNKSLIYKFFTSLSRTENHPKGMAVKYQKRLSRSDNFGQSLGFTLIEVLVVMIMVGILSAIAAPSWLAFVNNQRLSTSQSRVFSILREAQSSAKRSGTSTTVTIGNDSVKGAYIQTSRSQAQYLEQGIQVLSVDKSVDKEKTPPPTPIPLALPVTITFNSQGLPIYVNSVTDRFTDFPLRITLNITNSPNRKRCTTITTILGSVKSASDDECN